MAGHRIDARAAHHAGAIRVARDDDVIAGFLSDAAHVPGGFADGVAFPDSLDAVSEVVARSPRVLVVGAQSSLTGGATPRGEVVVSTRQLTSLLVTGSAVRVGAGVTIAELQRKLSQSFLYYPPAPTFDGASVGGTVSTNAAGAATFKYGATRPWVQGITVVLADGRVLDIARGSTWASSDGTFEVCDASGDVVVVPVPGYVMPDVVKLSAGYHARPGMDLIDLFIGAEGTLGVIVEATLGVVPLPRRCAAMVACESDEQALAVTAALRREAAAAWSGQGPLDVTAIEYMDARSLEVVPSDVYQRIGLARPAGDTAMVLAQIEIASPGHDDDAIGRLQSVLDACAVATDVAIALPGDTRGAQGFFDLREAVPAAVNARVAAAKARVHPGIQKTAGDFIVPFDRLGESIAIYRRECERRGLAHAIWGHASDGNLHVNVMPESLDDVERGRQALHEMARAVIGMGGSPLAEHGVGRSPLKQLMLKELYGEDGIAQMRAVKRALDPTGKLAPGVLFPP